MKYNSDTPKHILAEYINRVDSRWKQLNDLVLSIVTDGIKYLFYVNAGGCVAIIAFIGTSDSVRQLDWPWTVLCLFFIGVVFVGALNFSRYHIVDSLLSNWQKDVGVFYKGNLDFDEMTQHDDIRVEKSRWILLFAYAAFTCFIAGGAVGFVNYKVLIKGQPAMIEKIKLSPAMTGEQKNHVPKQTPIPPTPHPPK